MFTEKLKHIVPWIFIAFTIFGAAAGYGELKSDVSNNQKAVLELDERQRNITEGVSAIKEALKRMTASVCYRDFWSPG